MKKLLTLALLIALAWQCHAQQVNGSILADHGDFKIVKVWGTHQERGFATGYLLAEGVKDLFDNYLMPAFGSYYTMARQLMMSQDHIAIDSVYIYEAMAMADGLNASGVIDFEVDYIDVLLANSFLDAKNFIGKNLMPDNGCSSLISWGQATEGTALNGKSVLSRHLDWDDQPVIIRNQVMVIHLPAEEDEQKWALVGFAGQMSVLSGFNESGLAVMQHNLADVYASAGLSRAYEPIWFSLRKAIEKRDVNGDNVCNVLDVNAVIDANTFGYADAFIITAVAPAVYDTPEEIATIVEVASVSPYVTTRNVDYPDLIPGKNLYAANYAIARNDAVHTCMRYNAVRNNMGDGSMIGEHENWNIMLNYSSSCSYGGYGNIQFMQFVPENHMFKLAWHSSEGLQACEQLAVVYNTDDLFEQSSALQSATGSMPVHVFPNPASSIVTVTLNNESGITTLLIADVSGKIIKRLSLNALNNEIDISKLPSGFYLFVFPDINVQKKLFVY